MTQHWFLGKGQGPLRDGRPSFEEELAEMPPIADSCYRFSWCICRQRGYKERCEYPGLNPKCRYVLELAPHSPEPGEPSPD